MTSLLDIMGLSETVEIIVGGKTYEIDVWPLTADHIAHLMVKFQDFKALMEAKVEAPNFSLSDITEAAPETIAEVIAMALVSPGDFTDKAGYRDALAKTAVVIRQHAAANQIKIINKVLKLTFPEGGESFKTQLHEMKHFAESSGLAQASDSQEQSEDVFQPASPSMMRGTVAHVS